MRHVSRPIPLVALPSGPGVSNDANRAESSDLSAALTSTWLVHLPEAIRRRLGEILEAQTAFQELALRTLALGDVAHDPKLAPASGHVQAGERIFDREAAPIERGARHFRRALGRPLALRNLVRGRSKQLADPLPG